MKESDIRNAIELIIKDKQELEQQIQQLDMMLRRYKALMYQFEMDRTDNNNIVKSNDENSFPELSNVENTFPINEKVDEQILFLFKEVGRAIKLPKLDELYQKKITTDKSISHAARRMKNEGKLVIAKFNGVNKDSFWGLPEWVETIDGKKTYKPEKMPSREDLKFGQNTISFN